MFNIDHIVFLDKNKTILKISGWAILTNDNLYLENIGENILINLNTNRNDVKKIHNLNTSKVGFSHKIKIDENLKKIKFFTLHMNKEFEITDIEELSKDKKIYYVIDLKTIYNNDILIKGWAFSLNNYFDNSLDILFDDESIDYSIKTLERADVENHFSNYLVSGDIGFEIKIKNVKKIKNKDIIFYLKDDITEERIIIKKFEFTKIYRLIDYLKKNGVKNTSQKILSKYLSDKYKYKKFLKKHLPSKNELIKQMKVKFEYNPKISVVVPIWNTKPIYLKQMIESVRNQSYKNWELCMVDGNSSNKKTLEILKEYERKDTRIKVKYLLENLMISGNTNEAIKMASGDYVGFFDHDDLLTPNALYEIVNSLNKEEIRPNVIYTDEDKTNEKGDKFFEPYFKSDYNPFMLRSNNYITHFLVVEKKLLDSVGYLRKEYDGAQDYDLVLRLTEKAKFIHHIPKILYHWRVHKNSTAYDSSSKSYTIEAGYKAIQDHLRRMGINGEVENGFAPNFYKVNYKSDTNPMVSIIISNKDHIDDLQLCIDSLDKSTYSNYEIIVVENNSITTEIFDYYSNITSQNPKVRIVKWTGKEFNYSSINNLGAKEAKGEILLLLNNDIELITEDWLEQMVGIYKQKNVGIVGPKLYFPDDTIQHAGVIIGTGGIAGHLYKGVPRYNPGMFGKLYLIQNVSAVTGAVLMIGKDIFEEVGGLDEERFKVALNDVDLCLKVREKGYQIVWTPWVELYHHESKSRGYEDTPQKIKRFEQEIKNYHDKWGKNLEDPYYNINLTQKYEYPHIRDYE